MNLVGRKLYSGEKNNELHRQVSYFETNLLIMSRVSERNTFVPSAAARIFPASAPKIKRTRNNTVYGD